MLGQRLDEYELVKALGTGGMGAVFEARHTTTGQRVAIKVLHPAFADSPKLFERFRTEAKIGATIGHPAIVEVFGFGATKEGCPYLVMELLEGRPFEALLESPVPIDTAVSVTIELMDALDAAHRHGFVHRDLKPANLFLSRAGQTERVRLLDFGIAHVMTPELQQALTGSAIIGTPGYMAPEQLDATAIDARVDLYAAGCILFELLTGRRAVEGRSRSEVLLNSLRGEFPKVSTLRPDVPPALEALVAQLLEKTPSRRPASAGEVRERLQALGNVLHTRPTQRETRQPTRNDRPAQLATPAVREPIEELREAPNLVHAPRVAPSRWWVWSTLAVVASVLLTALVLKPETPRPPPAPITIPVEPPAPPIEVPAESGTLRVSCSGCDGAARVEVSGALRFVELAPFSRRVPAGTYSLRLMPDGAAGSVTVFAERVTRATYDSTRGVWKVEQ